MKLSQLQQSPETIIQMCGDVGNTPVSSTVRFWKVNTQYSAEANESNWKTYIANVAANGVAAL